MELHSLVATTNNDEPMDSTKPMNNLQLVVG